VAKISSRLGPFQIACPSVRQCTVIDEGGDLITFDPRAPGRQRRDLIDPKQAPSAISCPTVSFGAMVDADGRIVTGDPQADRWPLRPILPGDFGINVDCPSPSECVVVDGRGRAFLGLTPVRRSAKVGSRTSYFPRVREDHA
jgi:hypothetical protein